MTDTFRELCAEVLAFHHGEGCYNFSGLNLYDRDNAAFDAWQDIRQRLKSALAQPAPALAVVPVEKGPSIDDIRELCVDNELLMFVDSSDFDTVVVAILEIARAVLARWGHPATLPAPEVLSAEVEELVAALELDADRGDHFYELANTTAEQFRRAATLLQQKQPLNIIFTGPPGPGNDCVFIDVETDDGRSVRVGEWSQRQDGHWALRLPNSVTSPSSGEVQP